VTGVLRAEDFRHYIDEFNADDDESIKQLYPNTGAWDFLSKNMPLLEFPDEDIQRTYYFRWWTFRKHLKKTQEGVYVITEFLPGVPWAGKENTISCPAGHHFREGRWLHDPKYLNDYAKFWLKGGGSPRSYSFWIADSIWQHAIVTGDTSTAKELLPDLVANDEAWEKDRLDPNGLFWQIDDRDGMEVSIGGSGYRVTINSYMYGDAMAIARIAVLSGKMELAERYYGKAFHLRARINEKLWDGSAGFYKVAPRTNDDASQPLRLADVREEHGYTPWYFEAAIPKPEYDIAWRQLLDPDGFYAPFGPTTAEQRHPGFKIAYQGHECQWNGPSWPFATSVTLTGLANLIFREKTNDSEANVESLCNAWRKTLQIYAKSHRREREDGKAVCWIDENLNPLTGDWISRTRLKVWNNGAWDTGKGGKERGKDYNHSTFCDLVINGLIGFRPGINDSFEICPIVDPDIEYFCLDNVLYHGRIITIVYDKTGDRYKIGKGFKVIVDGKTVVERKNLPERVETVLMDHHE